MRRIASLFLILVGIERAEPSYAGTDPTEAVMVARYTVEENKVLKSFAVAQALMTTGHLWTQSEVAGMTAFQKEFDQYLSTFHSLVGCAASIYGIYYESNQLGHNISRLNKEFHKHSANALAVALSTNRNKIYRQLLYEGMQIAYDIKIGFFDEDKKATEWERMKVLSKIQPKMKAFNKDLRKLIVLMEYTTMDDVWREISNQAYALKAPDKAAIITRARKNWIQTAKHIR